MSGAGVRDVVIAREEGFRWSRVGESVMVIGFILYVLGALFGFLGQFAGTEPPISFGSRATALGTEYYVPGLLFVLLPWLVYVVSPRLDRGLRGRERFKVAQQMGYRVPAPAYAARSFRWRRIALVVWAAALVAAPVIIAVTISADGFALTAWVYVFAALGAVALVGTVLQLFVPYRRVRVDAEGHVQEAPTPAPTASEATASDTIERRPEPRRGP